MEAEKYEMGNQTKNILKVKTKAKGLPAKSFMYIIDLDYYLRLALSYLSNTDFFDIYISSNIKYKYKQKDRKYVANSFIKYMCIYDESRINTLFYSKFINREILILFINNLAKSITYYRSIKEKYVDDLTNEELKYLWQFNFKLGKFTPSIVDNFPFIVRKINNIHTLITDHYLSFILKNLMLRRKSTPDPDKLKSDAFDVIVDMVNSYNPTKSKVPFNSYLKFFIKSKKNKIIIGEKDLAKHNTISLDQAYETSKDEIDNEIFQTFEKYIYLDRNVEEYLDLIEKVSNELPLPFKNLLLLNYNIVNPLTPTEEIELLL